MFEGLLVDLVPYGKDFLDRENEWANAEASFWGSGGDRRIVSRAQTQARLQRWAEALESGHDTGVAFGIRAKDGTPLGFMGLTWVLPYHRLAMLGAKIGDPDYWSGGYGTDALLLVIDYAFDWLDMHKLWLTTTGFNRRVMRQMEKVGFTLESRARRETLADGQWHDGLFYGLLRTEWPGRDAKIEQLGLRVRAEG
jgi:RimJ/RimL family protein N-acetyltransferase